MIIDQIPLAGELAFLRLAASPGLFNTASASLSAPYPRHAVAPLVPHESGHQWSVSAIDLFLEAPDLRPFMTRQTHPLMRFAVRKEMFPGLFRDPYSHRVHRIGGTEDFRRSSLKGLTVMEVDGVPTLVSIAELCEWVSPMFHIPRGPGQQELMLHSAAWDIPASRLAPSDGLKYQLGIKVLVDVDDVPVEHMFRLADNYGLEHARVAQHIDPALAQDAFAIEEKPITGIRGYQLIFQARVNQDRALHEHSRRSLAGLAQNLGRPVLTAVHLLERVESQFSFHSLTELLRAAVTYTLFQEPDGIPRRLTARIPLAGSIGRGEQVSMTLFSPDFTVVEAIAAGTRALRPPATDKN